MLIKKYYRVVLLTEFSTREEAWDYAIKLGLDPEFLESVWSVAENEEEED